MPSLPAVLALKPSLHYFLAVSQQNVLVVGRQRFANATPVLHQDVLTRREALNDLGQLFFIDVLAYVSGHNIIDRKTQAYRAALPGVQPKGFGHLRNDRIGYGDTHARESTRGAKSRQPFFGPQNGHKNMSVMSGSARLAAGFTLRVACAMDGEL